MSLSSYTTESTIRISFYIFSFSVQQFNIELENDVHYLQEGFLLKGCLIQNILDRK